METQRHEDTKRFVRALSRACRASRGGCAAPQAYWPKLVMSSLSVPYLPPDKFAGRIKDDYVKWGKVIKDNGIKSD